MNTMLHINDHLLTTNMTRQWSFEMLVQIPNAILFWLYLGRGESHVFRIGEVLQRHTLLLKTRLLYDKWMIKLTAPVTTACEPELHVPTIVVRLCGSWANTEGIVSAKTIRGLRINIIGSEA